jgi:Hemerythrin HHE cation binding domain
MSTARNNIRLFSFLSRLLRDARQHDNVGEATTAVPRRSTVPHTDGAPIGYRPDLIDELKREHRLLRASFAALAAAHRDGDGEACVDSLRIFTNALRAHLLKENLQLYRYLKLAFRADEGAAARTTALRQQMQAIGKALNAFASDYVGASWDKARRIRLGAELETIGRILDQRIDTEEEALYPLYLPPDRY